MGSTREILRFDRWQRRILRLVKNSNGLIRIRHLDYSTPDRNGARWPIYLLEIGRPGALKKHAVTLVSGVHGLETIGIRIHLDILKSLINPKSKFYSPDLQAGKFGIYSIPIMNPAGVARLTRANARGIDLNRNSGIRAEKPLPFFGGHSLSALLPYYRGKTRQRESRALFRFLYEHVWRRRKKIHMALDIHSGYGADNFIWWPYAFSDREVFQEKAFTSIADALKEKHPAYRFEPMAASYQMHGDLWDYALLEFEKLQRKNQKKKSLFLPYTFEIGTWQEIKKDPRRLFNRQKIFNPPPESRKAYLKDHRQLLCDFIHLYAQRAKRREFLKTIQA